MSKKDKEPYVFFFLFCFPVDSSCLEAINCAAITKILHLENVT